MYYRRASNAIANPSRPRAFAVCDRCGLLYNHKDLEYQFQWNGPRLRNIGILVCETCLDKPQPQLRLFTIPADPIPIHFPRQEQYTVEVPSFLVTLSSAILVTEGGDSLVLEYQTTPVPDPKSPVVYPP